MPVVVNLGTDTPPVTPPEPPVGNPAIATDLLALTWTGWNGDTWEVQGDSLSKAIMERYGRVGFGMPPIEHFYTQSATLNGTTWNGYRVPGRPFGFPVFVTGSSPTEARAEQARFLTTMRPDKVGTLTVADPTGARRYIDLRYQSGADGEFESSEYAMYWYSHQLQMLAEDPFYYGDAIPLEFVAPGNVNFYGGGDGTQAPLFYVGESRTTGNAVVPNPGDVDAWPIWTLHGPFTSATLTVGGATINFPADIGAGHWLKIDTRLKNQLIVDDLGANRWNDAGAVAFAPIPASASTQLGLTLDGSDVDTKVEVEFTPNFWRAW